jgi:hypothetical protein
MLMSSSWMRSSYRWLTRHLLPPLPVRTAALATLSLDLPVEYDVSRLRVDIGGLSPSHSLEPVERIATAGAGGEVDFLGS